MLERHNAATAAISRAVRAFYKDKVPFRINHGSTNSTRDTPKRNTVDTSSLRNVLSVDKATRTALVEPNVPMDRLVDTTLKHGLVPPVVMEFPGITAGGGYAGTCGESSSFKHGFFNRTVQEVEMVLANGEVVTASEEERADLFHGAAGAIGTLGITTLVKLQLVEAKKFVAATYHPISGGVTEALAKIEEVRGESDYVDGILYDKNNGVIVSGRATNDIDSSTSIQRFTRPRDPWFYLHVREALARNPDPNSPTTEAIPLYDYLFRYDRGGFWVGKSAFDYFHFPFNRHTRRFLDDFLRTRMLYRALQASHRSREYVIQDLALPTSAAADFVNYTDKEFAIYPLWLCPLKQSLAPTMHPHHIDPVTQEQNEMLNIGLWGPGPTDYKTFVAKNRSLEAKLRELGGMKWLYAHTYYNPSDFWAQFDKSWYDKLRAKYHASHLPSVYDKVAVDVESEGRKVEKLRKSAWGRVVRWWPVNGFVAIWASIRSREYLLAVGREGWFGGIFNLKRRGGKGEGEGDV